MLRAASLMRCAITRRMPMTGISCTAPASAAGAEAEAGAGVVAGAADPDEAGAALLPSARTDCRSSGVMRPPVPLPAIAARSTPASWARRRVAGEARTDAEGTGDAGAAGAAAPPAGTADLAVPVSVVSKVASSDPTAMTSPGLPLMVSTRPLTGAGISTTALSVDISTSGWSSLTTSPGFTCQATISAETVPSPRSGSLKTWRLIDSPSRL